VSKVVGTKQLAKRLEQMRTVPRRKALRSAAFGATLPALNQAKANAPVGDPPYVYHYESYLEKDPYPVRDWKGRLRVPGNTATNIARKTIVSPDGLSVSVLIGVRPIAFYSIQFVEFGTSRHAAEPWLEPAFRQSVPEMDQRLQVKLRAAIDKAARS